MVDSAFDVSAQEEIRLIRPLVLKVMQQPATVAYPFKYLFVSFSWPLRTNHNSFISTEMSAVSVNRIVETTCLPRRRQQLPWFPEAQPRSCLAGKGLAVVRRTSEAETRVPLR